MKIQILASLAVMAVSMPAFALGELNCSNATGTVRLVEKEIWGKNPVTFEIGGQSYKAMDVDAQFSEVNVLKHHETVGSNSKTYSALLSIKFKDGEHSAISEYVICHRWWNSARD